MQQHFIAAAPQLTYLHGEIGTARTTNIERAHIHRTTQPYNTCCNIKLNNQHDLNWRSNRLSLFMVRSQAQVRTH